LSLKNQDIEIINPSNNTKRNAPITADQKKLHHILDNKAILIMTKFQES